MKVLLDENFPLGLVRTLHADGLAADHIITLGIRGATDDQIRDHLQDEGVLFLTQDEDFLFGESVPAIVVLSSRQTGAPIGRTYPSLADRRPRSH